MQLRLPLLVALMLPLALFATQRPEPVEQPRKPEDEIDRVANTQPWIGSNLLNIPAANLCSARQVPQRSEPSFEKPALVCYKSDLRHALNFAYTGQNSGFQGLFLL